MKKNTLFLLVVVISTIVVGFGTWTVVIVGLYNEPLFVTDQTRQKWLEANCFQDIDFMTATSEEMQEFFNNLPRPPTSMYSYNSVKFNNTTYLCIEDIPFWFHGRLY